METKTKRTNVLRTEVEKMNIVASIIESNKSTRTMCEHFGIRPSQFYTWRDLYVSEDAANIRRRVLDPKPISTSDFNFFQSECKDQIKDTLEKMYNQWRENDIIAKINSKITNCGQLTVVAQTIGTNDEQLRLFLTRKSPQFPFHMVDKIVKHLNILV